MCGSREWYLGVVSSCLEGTHSVVCFHQYTAYRHCCFHSLCVCLSIRRDEGPAMNMNIKAGSCDIKESSLLDSAAQP